MQKWEYKIHTFLSSDENYIEDYMIDYGEEGWEAVCVIHHNQLLMKRPKKEKTIPAGKDPEPGIPAICQ